MTEDSRKPFILIHNDAPERPVSKALWSHLAGQEVELVNSATPDDMAARAESAHLIIFYINNQIDIQNSSFITLSNNDRIVSPLVAVLGPDAPAGASTVLAASGVDIIYPIDIVINNSFRQVLVSKLSQAARRMKQRLKSDYYSKFESAIATSATAFIVFDKNRQIALVSPHYKKALPVWGYKLVPGLPLIEAFNLYIREEKIDETNPYYQGMREFWMRLEGQYDFITDEGRVWRLRARPLPEDQGTIVTTIDITKYVTQQKELEQKTAELAQALQKEQEASAIQKQFVNMVSHEFRTPLSIIDGHVQILQRRADGLTPDDLRKRAGIIRSAVSRLVTMMEGILSSNMMRTGHLSVVRGKFDLAGTIGDLCDEYADLSRDIEIQAITKDLPPSVDLDRKIMTLILSNLIGNAVKFSRENPHIRIVARADDAQIHIDVEDNGIGIPEKEIPRIFERYYRATTAQNVPGTGIGLNLVRDLVHLHGGTITLKSVEGKGTTVTIAIPCR